MTLFKRRPGAAVAAGWLRSPGSLTNLSAVGTLKNMNQSARGFTIVELLIVIVVIAILAAISVAAYSSIQHRARTSAVHTDLSSAKKKLALFRVDNGRYPASTTELIDAGISISDNSNYDIRTGYSNFYYCLDVANDNFALGVRVAGSPTYSFYVTSVDAITPFTGLISGSTTCGALGLPGATAADGAFLTYGITATGIRSDWI